MRIGLLLYKVFDYNNSMICVHRAPPDLTRALTDSRSQIGRGFGVFAGIMIEGVGSAEGDCCED